MKFFQWGARQIKSSEQIKRKESIFHLAGPDSDVEDNETDGELSSDGGLRRRHGSGASEYLLLYVSSISLHALFVLTLLHGSASGLSSLASVCSNKRIRRNSSSCTV